MMQQFRAFLAVALTTCCSTAVAGAEPLEQRFSEGVQPFLKSYCLDCHGAKKQEGKLDLSGFTSLAAVAKNHRVWNVVLERLEANEMPPESAKQPKPHERRAVLDWINDVRDDAARRNAGDPGTVLARRLSNAEYDYTIRDLTGVDIRPTREFPVDPANEAGFDNSGESLTMSPALLKKHLAAARLVADHLVLKPDGFVFAPHSVVTDTDRDKYCVQRIIDFYQRRRVDLADYFFTAWRFERESSSGQAKTITEIARNAGLSATYLELVWKTLKSTQPEAGPLAVVQAQWHGLPAEVARQDEARRGCERMRDYVLQNRKRLEPKIDRMHFDGMTDGSQPFVLWKNREVAARRRQYTVGTGVVQNVRAFEHKLTKANGDIVLSFAIDDGGDGGTQEQVVWRGVNLNRTGGPKGTPEKPQVDRWTLRALLVKFAPEEAAKLQFGRHPQGDTLDADSFVQTAPAAFQVTIPAAALFNSPDNQWTFSCEGAIDRAHFAGGAVRLVCVPQKLDSPEVVLADQPFVIPAGDPALPRFEASLQQFCRVFPDTFVMTDRGPYFDPNQAGQGRLLTAGFHLMQGYFRDDAPLCELILDEADRRELDKLWLELDFVTATPIRQFKDFIFFERTEGPQILTDAEFDFARSEDKDAVSTAKMEQLARMYFAKAKRLGAKEPHLEAIRKYFTDITASVRQVERLRLAAEPSHLAELKKFAERAFRRPLSVDEAGDVVAFYRLLRDKDQLTHEEAMRDSIVAILMSPEFSYRYDLAEAGQTVRPLSDAELASRLSYFLWSSLPDDELLAHVKTGDLHQRDILIAQSRRMLRDARVRGLAAEFGGNWLDCRRFEEHNSVDRVRFSTFNNDLRQAMFEEPLRFFVDVAREDRSVLDFLYAEHTFVNPVLAAHYGIPLAKPVAVDWVKVDDAGKYGRGGLLPMSVFLTSNSPGLRTSPVKRGYWVVRRLLGEHIPSPPTEVPELPKDEAKLGDLTLPQLLAKHREQKSCAACHQRFDAVGLVFEGYGPIGERRTQDLGGKPINATALFPDGSTGTGLDGLKQYLRDKRQNEFVDNLCRKLLAYGLGRTLLLSDRSTVEAMRTRLTADGHRFGGLIETIVTSPQFLNKRGRDDARD